VKFVETTIFSRRLAAALTDDEYRRLQEALLRRPAQGDVIEGTGGIRKLRWAQQGRGKRGALRVIYYFYSARDTFLMLFLYKKNEQGDLTAEQRRLFAKLVRQEIE
jgi:hypothetical protein